MRTAVDSINSTLHVGQIRPDMIIYILAYRYEMSCRICSAQIRPKKRGLDHADYTALPRQHEVEHADQEMICSEGSIDHQA